jgi:Kef-type K+ transport system membrane component KefB
MAASATTGTILLDVAVVLVAARIGAALFARARQPAVIGELAAGVALGPTVLGALPGDPSEALFPAEAAAALEQIGEVGLALFMFTVGWELDLDVVRRRGRAAAAVSVASIVPALLLGLALAAYLHPRHDVVDGAAVPFGPFALFVAASMAVTAFPVLARILAETGLAGRPLGALAISAAAVDDVVGWSMLAVALAALASDGPWDYVRVAAESALFVAAVLLVVRPLLRRLLDTARLPPEAIVVPAALAGAAATDAIGIHAVFGAFLVGAAMPRPVEPPGPRRVAVVVGVLAPVYFVTSGMAVDVPGLRAGDVVPLVVVVAAACAGKFFGAFGGARAVGVDTREAAAVGVLMNTRGLIEIVLLTVGRDQGLIDDRLFTMLALMALVTTVATTPLLRAILPLREERLGRLDEPL